MGGYLEREAEVEGYKRAMKFFDLSSNAPIQNNDDNQNNSPQSRSSEIRTDASNTIPIPESGSEVAASLLDSIARPTLMAEQETESPYTHKRWSPTELKPRHREMMRRILEGADYVEIAASMGLSTQTVMLVCSSAIFKAELEKLEDSLDHNVIKRAEELSNEALDKLKLLMRKARSETLQASCAEKVLGIAGYSKIEKKQIAVVSGEDVIRELNRRRREAAEQFGGNAGSEAGGELNRPFKGFESQVEDI